MIVGSGLLARAFAPHFADNPDFVVFASGVSNSLENRREEFEREETLLREKISLPAARFIYFSSCGVNSVESDITPYMLHKKSMESLVLSVPHGLVFRLPQVVGKTKNSHTLTNFLRDRINSREHFTVWARAERNLIDIDDIVKLVVAFAAVPPEGASVISIASLRSLQMPEIVRIFEKILGKEAFCSYVDKGAPMMIDTRLVQRLSVSLGIDLGGDYVERIISKYYSAENHCDHPEELSLK